MMKFSDYFDLAGKEQKQAESKQMKIINSKGKKILAAMKKQYGAKRGEKVFYSAENKGTISGIKKKKGTIL